LVDYIGYYIFKLFSFIFCHIPPSVALWIGRRIGVLAYYINPKRRRIAHANLRAAFSSKYSPVQTQRIIKQLYVNLGQTLIETLILPRIDEAYIDKFIKCENFERIHEGLDKGKGVIALTAHFGNWELSSITGAIKVKPIYVLVREQKHKRLNALLNQHRESKGCRAIGKGMATRELMRAFKKNEIVGILADQDAGKNGVFVNFLGRPASTASGAVDFARKTGAVILPTFCIREKGPYHRQVIEKPLELITSDDREGDAKANLQLFADRLKRRVEDHPDQWLWLHKRWKSTPVRSILILDDGRTGHLNQSRAVADCLRRKREEMGFDRDATRITEVKVEFEHSLTARAIPAACFLSGALCQGCTRCLKFLLKRKSYEDLIHSYADIVISCGSSTSIVNLIMSRENNAKSIVVMKPPFPLLSRFDLAILPQHDGVEEGSNVVVTDGAPNLVNDEEMSVSSDRISKVAGIKKDPSLLRIGIILGGETAHETLSTELADRIIGGAMNAARELGAEILVTTSRRTAKDVEVLLKRRLGSFDRCKLLVIANEDNLRGAIPAILGLSRIVVVSGESTSMVSEAASSGKDTLVFELKKKGQSNRTDRIRTRFLENLSRKGFIKVIPTTKVYERIVESAGNANVATERLDDGLKIREAVSRVI